MIPFYQSVNGGPPEPITALTPAAWYRYGVGITSAGGLVSAWADQSGNSRNLLQATGTNQPALQADNSILFDGADNFLKTAGFTLAQPTTVYFLGKQVTWTQFDYIYDGDATNSGALRQNVSTPVLLLFATNQVAANGNLAVNTYGVSAGVYNGASSLLQINNTSPVSGDVGAGDMGGFTLGTRGAAGGSFGHIQVKEVILFPVAHDAATRTAVITYLATVGGLNI